MLVCSSPIVWTRKRPSKNAGWTVIDEEFSALLETAWRTGETATIVNEEIVSRRERERERERELYISLSLLVQF